MGYVSFHETGRDNAALFRAAFIALDQQKEAYFSIYRASTVTPTSH